MPAAAVGAVDVAALAVIVLLLLLAYALYFAGDNSPTFWPIGDSIKNLFYGLGDWVADRAGDVSDLVRSGTGYSIAQTIKGLHNLGLGIRNSISQLVTLWWGAIGPTVLNDYHQIVNGAIGATVADLYGQLSALQSSVNYIESVVGSIHIPPAFNPQDILNRLGWIENNVLPILESQMSAVQHDVSSVIPRVDSLARSVVNTSTYVITAVPALQHRVSVLEGEITGLITDVPKLRLDLTKFESLVAGEITAMGHDIGAAQAWISANKGLLTDLAILTIISALGAVGVRTLVDNAMNPCKCFSIGGDYEWLIPVVMANSVESL